MIVDAKRWVASIRRDTERRRFSISRKAGEHKKRGPGHLHPRLFSMPSKSNEFPRTTALCSPVNRAAWRSALAASRRASGAFTARALYLDARGLPCDSSTLPRQIQDTILIAG